VVTAVLFGDVLAGGIAREHLFRKEFLIAEDIILTVVAFSFNNWCITVFLILIVQK